MRLKLATALMALTCSLSGCVPALVQNRDMEPDVTPPAHFENHAYPTPHQPGIGYKTWSDMFASPALRKLVEEALLKNQELNLQIQELVIAQNEIAARRGEYLPKVGVGATVGGDRAGLFTSRGASDEAVGLPQNLGAFGFGLVASWEVDIWGKLRNLATSAEFRYGASVEGRKFLITQLVAEIARAYYELLAVDAKLEVLNRNIGIQTRALELIRVEKQAARVTELAVQRFEAEVSKNKSVRYDLQQERMEAENRINFLVGRYPQAVKRNPADFNAPLPPMLHAGVPAALLENRPDVKQAELELEAAKLDVKAARANFYPALSIEAGAGFSSFNLAHLLNPASLVGNLAGNLTAPLLNRAAIEAQYGTANALQIQAIIRYERTLLQAFTEVSNQLSNVGNVRQSFDVRSVQVEKLRRSVEMSTLLFRAARADYVEVLLTRRDLLEAEMERIEKRMAMQQSVVNLYQALGGGWRVNQPAATPAPAATASPAATPAT